MIGALVTLTEAQSDAVGACIDALLAARPRPVGALMDAAHITAKARGSFPVCDVVAVVRGVGIVYAARASRDPDDFFDHPAGAAYAALALCDALWPDRICTVRVEGTDGDTTATIAETTRAPGGQWTARPCAAP